MSKFDKYLKDAQETGDLYMKEKIAAFKKIVKREPVKNDFAFLRELMDDEDYEEQIKEHYK